MSTFRFYYKLSFYIATLMVMSYACMLLSMTMYGPDIQ